MTRMRALLTAVVVLAVGFVLSGCGVTLRDLPMPGTSVSGDTMQVDADFGDALNLSVGAPVKINGVDSGKVSSIGEKNFTAVVSMTISKDADLRQGAHARLRYTTPLGELFIDIKNPKTGPLMTDGSKLTLHDTETAPTVEDALNQASYLINGGGLAQLQTVTQELNTALNGHEQDYKDLINKASTFLTAANRTTGNINQVLVSLNSLSKTLNARKGTINRAMTQIKPAAEVLRKETPGFTRLLKEINKFASTANGTVHATRAQLLRMLQQIQPVLATFASNRGRWDASLQSLMRAAAIARNVIPGDYLNISLNLHLDSVLTGGNIPGLGDLLNLLGLGNLLGGGKNGGGGLLGGVLGGLTGNKTAAASQPKSGTKTPSVSGLLNNLLGGGH